MTREEAINEIKSWDFLKGKEIEAIHTLIPELRESEDERIRKWLIKTIHLIGVDKDICADQETMDKAIAWLEKQKINTEGDFGRGYDCGYQAGYAVAMNEMMPKVATATLDSEKQKEQEQICDSAQYEEGFKTGLEIGLRKQKEQKPAEWSKEDEGMLKWIEDILLIADHDLSDKLNGRVSPISDSAYSSMKLCIAKCLSWLKSLRPSWKPSKEQMEALWDAYKGGKEQEPLRELIEQLKKL